MTSPIGDEVYAAQAAAQRANVTGPLLRGWICPVCGAGVAPWKVEHCTPQQRTP